MSVGILSDSYIQYINVLRISAKEMRVCQLETLFVFGIRDSTVLFCIILITLIRLFQ